MAFGIYSVVLLLSYIIFHTVAERRIRLVEHMGWLSYGPPGFLLTEIPLLPKKRILLCADAQRDQGNYLYVCDPDLREYILRYVKTV